MRQIIFALLLTFLLNNPSNSQNVVIVKDSIEIKYDTSLQKIVEMHKEIKSFYKVLEKLQPIAIAENNYFYIFDVSENSDYKFIKKIPVNFPIPKGIRAAMPIESYDFKCVCVVTGDAFDRIEDRIVIFHEFVHCSQFNSVELKLKENLDIYKQAMEKQDYMWELNYSFPYANDEFVNTYSEFLNVLDKQDSTAIKYIRKSLKNMLYKKEFEYMTWQEWKEGYARFIENRLRTHYNLKINDYGKEKPFSRITFYSGGSKFIDYLVAKELSLENDLELLYKYITEYK